MASRVFDARIQSHEKRLGGRRLLVIKQRERKQVPVWHLLFCQLFNESAYWHLGLQFYNLIVCRNPTSPNDCVPDRSYHCLEHAYCSTFPHG